MVKALSLGDFACCSNGWELLGPYSLRWQRNGTLHRWVEQGKLTSLGDMGGKQRWFAREDVEQLINRDDNYNDLQSLSDPPQY